MTKIALDLPITFEFKQKFNYVFIYFCFWENKNNLEFFPDLKIIVSQKQPGLQSTPLAQSQIRGHCPMSDVRQKSYRATNFGHRTLDTV